MSLFQIIKRNPVVISGVVLSLLTAIYEAGVADGFTPATLVPVVLSFLTRQFTVPADEVVYLEEGDTVVTAEGDVLDVDLS